MSQPAEPTALPAGRQGQMACASSLRLTRTPKLCKAVTTASGPAPKLTGLAQLQVLPATCQASGTRQSETPSHPCWYLYLALPFNVFGTDIAHGLSQFLSGVCRPLGLQVIAPGLCGSAPERPARCRARRRGNLSPRRAAGSGRRKCQ